MMVVARFETGLELISHPLCSNMSASFNHFFSCLFVKVRWVAVIYPLLLPVNDVLVNGFIEKQTLHFLALTYRQSPMIIIV